MERPQTRREFLATLALATGAPALLRAPALLGARAQLGARGRGAVRSQERAIGTADVLIVEFSDAGTRLGPVRVPKIVKPESEWRTLLTPLAFAVTRHADTERAFTGAYWNLHETGLFRCVCCGTALFSSAHKFDSGTGWPSFWQPIAAENVVGPRAQSAGADETEVTCRRCDAHLGDIFDDGPRPTGLRYCIDSVALRFVRAG